MIDFTPKQHHKSHIPDSHRSGLYASPSKLSIHIIMAYAAALRIQNTKKYGNWDILLN